MCNKFNLSKEGRSVGARVEYTVEVDEDKGKEKATKCGSEQEAEAERMSKEDKEVQPGVPKAEETEKGKRSAGCGGGGGSTRTFAEPSEKRLKLAAEIWRRTEIMLSRFDEAERVAWWKDMEEMRRPRSQRSQRGGSETMAVRRKIM